MSELLKAGIYVICLFFVLFSLGSYVLIDQKKRQIPAASFCIFGFILYFFLFEFIAFPMMVLQRPLSELSIVWGILLGILVIVSCIKFGPYWIGRWKNREEKQYCASFFVMIVLVGVQCAFVALWTDNSPDAAYYVANVTANVATDTINIYEPFTGIPQEQFYVRYLFGLYPVHNSVASQVTGIHPLVLTKTVMSVATVILSYLVYAMIGEKLTGGNRKQVWRTLSFLAVIQFFFHTVYSNASFLLTRGYEGKAILANVVLPFVLYLALCLMENIDDRMSWFLLFCTGIAGVDISMSGMSILPVAVTGAAFLAMLYHRRWKKLKAYLICILPSVLILAVYLLASKGYLVFKI